MLKWGPLIILITGFSSHFVGAAQFQALVDTNQLTYGETLSLKLELSDTSTSYEPNLSPLENLFNIYGRQQFQSTQFVNGQVSSKTGWQYTLEPKKTGTLIIPSLSLQTAAGLLQTQPITITVRRTPMSQRRPDQTRLETIVSDSTPYLHQPIHYTLRFYHRGDWRDLEPIPPNDNVIIEKLSDLTQRRTIINGQQIIVAQISYILTPLRSGALDLGSARMKGLKPDQRSSRFGSGFFNFNNYRPVTISSLPVTLEVQAPPISQSIWLPLKNLKLEQNWESDISQSVLVGVPLIRTITLVAEGMGGQSPPVLEDFVLANDDFRVRNPKPEIERSLGTDRKTPISTIVQSFSLIPLKTGQLQLPTVRIPWWDVQKETLVWAELPAQTIHVVPNQNEVRFTDPQTTLTEETVLNQSTRSQPLSFSQVQYVALGIAISALLIALGYSWSSRRQRTTLAPEPKTPSISHTVFKKRLKSAETLIEIKQLIQEYAHLRWQMHPNRSLQTIAQQVVIAYDFAEPLAELINTLNAALYGQQSLDLTDWKKRYLIALTQLKEKKVVSSKKTPQATLEPLNPI